MSSQDSDWELDTGDDHQVDQKDQAFNQDFSGLNISTSSFHLQPIKVQEVYSNEIPDIYLPGKLHYPYHSPYEYSDEQFDQMNHFDFLHGLNFKEPPLLPPYLNSNLLNDSSSHNYKTYPYQFQHSNHIYINDQYRYNINELNTMDKYSYHNPYPTHRSRPATSSNQKSTHRHELRKRNSSNSKNTLLALPLKKSHSVPVSSSSTSSSETHSTHKHQRTPEIEEEAIRRNEPNHVMLNHLITSNSKSDDVITSSCIHRYSGKFITQILYFPIDVEEVRSGGYHH